MISCTVSVHVFTIILIPMYLTAIENEREI